MLFQKMQHLFEAKYYVLCFAHLVFSEKICYIKLRKEVPFLKRSLCFFLTLLLLLTLCPVTGAASAPSYAAYSDVTVTVNGHPLRSYSVNCQTAVAVEDLSGYGFTVRWNGSARTIKVTRETPLPTVWPEYTPATGQTPGEWAADICATNIKTYVNGKQVDSYNIGGRTLILFSSLSVFGPMVTDDAARTCELTLKQYRPEQKLHILMYHDIVKQQTGKLGDWTTTAELFRQDMQWLRDHGYTSYLPSEIINGPALSDKAVLITFDDGYLSNYTLALPILREYGMKAVVSVVTSYMDNVEEGFLTWEDCRKLAGSGLVEIGSHTDTLHEEGIRRRSGEAREDYEKRVAADLDRSTEAIRTQIGQEPLFFAYPHGWRDSWADALLKERFDMSVTTKHGSATVPKNLYDLPRYNINSVQPVSMFLPK